MKRPRRYPRDGRLSSIVDQIQAFEDELHAAGDDANAARLALARVVVVDVARGVER